MCAGRISGNGHPYTISHESEKCKFGEGEAGGSVSVSIGPEEVVEGPSKEFCTRVGDHGCVV